MRKKWLKERAANCHFIHSSLLALAVVILQAGKVHSNSDINNIKYNNNNQQYKSNMSMHVWVPTFWVTNKECGTQRIPRSLMQSVWVVHLSHSLYIWLIVLFFLEEVMTLVLSVLSQQHTNSKWNPRWVVEVYCQLQVYSAKILILSANKKCVTITTKTTTTIQFSFTSVPA
jgi:hypothetical protein